MLTTLDVLGRRNNREHHVIAKARDKFDRVSVVYRKRGAPDRGLGAMLSAGRTVEQHGNVTYIGVDPFLNPPDGKVRANTQSGDGGHRHLRKMLGHGMDTVAILRDIATIRALHDAGLSAIGGGVPVTMALGPWAARAAERLRAGGHIGPYVYVDRDYEPGFMTSPFRKAWARAQERRAARRADRTLCIGHRLAKRFDDQPQARISISPTGVDCAAIPCRLRHQSHAALLFVGEVAPWSGIEETIAALPAIAATMPDATLRVIGPVQDRYRAHLEKLAAAAGVSDRVTLLGSRERSEVFEELDKASIGLAIFRPHPLRIHAAPLKLLEYMAAGLPALALDGSEAGDIVTRAGAGETCLCTGGDIARAVLKMTAEPDVYRAQSAAGPPAAAARDWARVMDAEFALICQLYDTGTAARKGAGAT